MHNASRTLIFKKSRRKNERGIFRFKYIDFKTIFSKLAQYNYEGWAVMEWECCLKNQEDGAREGAEFIKKHIIKVTDKAFDDFMSKIESFNALLTLIILTFFIL